jgi:signal transduction histidine kinase
MKDLPIIEQQTPLSVLLEMSTRLSAAHDLPELYRLLLDSLQELTQAEQAGLVLVDPQTGELSPAAARGFDLPTGNGLFSEVSQANVRRVLTTGAPVPGDQAPGRPSEPAQTPIIYLPLPADGRVLGAVYLEKLPGDPFTAEEFAQAAVLANQAGLALELARCQAASRETAAAKSDFVSLVTHELRLPMTAIKGYTDLILAELVGPLTDQQREFLTVVKRSLQRMNALISDLSDINRIDGGRMRFDLAPVELGELVVEVVDELRAEIRQRKQTLLVELADDLPLIYADRSRLTQTLRYLISNANKYTPEEGIIELVATKTDPHVTVTVRDNGIGISEADQAQLFTQFFRSEEDRVRQQVGWGLGLALVKRLVEAQGGAVHCRSQPGQGSAFSFTVPAAPLPEAAL